jgi:protein-S-isoprenylcysteine O-methyltransferase Ste14
MIASKRTLISQALGVLFFFVFAVSEKVIAHVAPYVSSAMFAIGCFLAGVAVVGRAWCAVYIAGRKNKELTRDGPYSLCRNPLYFFSFLGAVGIGLCTTSIILTAIVIAVFAILYPITIASEERALRAFFGAEYDEYMAQTPRFLPRPSLFREPQERLVNAKVFRRELFDSIYFVVLIGVFASIDDLREYEVWTSLFKIY